VGKAWSVLFGAVLLASFGLFLAAPFIPGWWLPGNLSPYGSQVDVLFYVILGMTGFFFVLTEVVLVYNMWQFGHVPDHKSEYTHGNHRLELFWTAIPAVLLLFIAIVQIRTWEDIKYLARFPPSNEVLQVTGRQWEWRIRHPVQVSFANLTLGKDLELLSGEKRKAMDKKIADLDLVPVSPRGWADNPEADDIHLVNELHTWKHTKDEPANVKVYLKTADVIHSFNLPSLRLKQDALPGKTIPIWFSVSESNLTYDEDRGVWIHADKPGLTYELTCAELCGARHYAMRGRLCVHETKADYLYWLKRASEMQKSSSAEDKVRALTILADRLEKTGMQ